ATSSTQPESFGIRSLRSVIAPHSYRKARGDPPPRGSEEPTTWPNELRPLATLSWPPRVPRSYIVPSLQTKACSAPPAARALPTTWPSTDGGGIVRRSAARG